MNLGLIFARARNGVIGKAGGLPWQLPEDMAHFKQITMGCPVIMGRKTWDSLPVKFRPLPGRANIVITRQPDLKEAGAQIAASLSDALALCASAEEIWIIGGAHFAALRHRPRLQFRHVPENTSGSLKCQELDFTCTDRTTTNWSTPCSMPAMGTQRTMDWPAAA